MQTRHFALPVSRLALAMSMRLAGTAALAVLRIRLNTRRTTLRLHPLRPGPCQPRQRPANTSEAWTASPRGKWIRWRAL